MAVTSVPHAPAPGQRFSLSPPDLPQTGRHTDEYWAAALGEQLETFRGKCRAAKIPMVKWGGRWIVDAADFHRHLDELADT